MKEWLKRLRCVLMGGHHKIFNRSKLRLECLCCPWHSEGIEI